MRLVIMLGVAVLIAGCGSKPEGQASSNAAPTAQAASQMAADKFIPEQKFLALGIQDLRRGKPVEAIRSFDAAIKQNPRDPNAYLVLGETYMHLKNYDRAIDTLSAATRIAPEKGEFYYFLALNYELKGDKDQAKVNAQKSFELFRLHQDEENLKKSLALLRELSVTEQ